MTVAVGEEPGWLFLFGAARGGLASARASAVNLPYELDERGFLLLYGVNEFELRATAVEVVAGPVDAEINIPQQEIREETQADGVGDELAGEDDEVLFRRREKLSRRRQVAAGQRLEHRHMQAHFAQVQLVLHRGTGGGAHHVAEIVERQAGHDGVQVHHAQGISRIAAMS